jgi:FkbM family methyltransferase
VHAIVQSILPGDIVFDIGAHAGVKAAWFAELGAKVICIEPQPAMVQKLKQRFDRNPLVTIVPKGVASQPGKLEMSINSKNPDISTFSHEWKSGRFSNMIWDQIVLIEVATFDQLVAEYGCPRYAKVDVEGFETAVFGGLNSRVGCISFEFTSEFLVNAAKIAGHLIEIGYSKFNFSIGESEQWFLPSWSTREDMFSALSTICGRDSQCWGDIYAN